INAACHGDNALTILTVNLWQSGCLHHRPQISDTNTCAHRVVYYDVLNILYRLSVLLLIAHPDVVLLTLFTVLRQDKTIDSVADRIGSGTHVQPVQCQLLPVKLNLVLHPVILAGDDDVSESIYPIHSLLQLTCYPIGHRQIVAENLKCHIAATGHAHVTT